eukprot:5208346-Pleurochrysis_carterae.AAC.5
MGRALPRIDTGANAAAFRVGAARQRRARWVIPQWRSGATRSTEREEKAARRARRAVSRTVKKERRADDIILHSSNRATFMHHLVCILTFVSGYSVASYADARLRHIPRESAVACGRTVQAMSWLVNSSFKPIGDQTVKQGGAAVTTEANSKAAEDKPNASDVPLAKYNRRAANPENAQKRAPGSDADSYSSDSASGATPILNRS